MVLKSDCFEREKKTMPLQSPIKIYHYSMHYVQLNQRETDEILNALEMNNKTHTSDILQGI